MKPKNETTGRSGGSPSAARAASRSPGRKRCRSTELGTTVEPTAKTSATSRLIAIDVVDSLRIARRMSADRVSLPRSGSADRRSGRAVDVWLELLAVELSDQVGERLRRAAELRSVVDEEDRDRTALAHRLMLAVAPGGLRFLHDHAPRIRVMARIGFDGLMI